MTPELWYLHGLTIDGRDGAVLARALPGFRVHAPDLPGHGATPTVEDWRPRSLAAALVPPRRAVVVGHSWGAAIAAWVGALAPERVSALALLEGGWFDRADLPRRAPPRAAAHRRALDALFDHRTSEAWPALAAAPFPVLAVAGTLGDDGVHRARLDAFAAHVPRARTVAWPSVGHDLLRDAPDLTGALLAAFLTPAPD